MRCRSQFGRGREMAARRGGNILVLVLLILALAAGSAFLANRLYRQRNLATHRYLYGEVALHLARGALEEADWDLLCRRLARRDEEAARQLLTLPADRIDWTEEIPIVLAERLTAGLPGGASIACSAQLAAFKPLAARPFQGIEPDPIEKRGRLVMMAEATYGGLTRRVIVQREVTVVSLLPPLVSRFSLFSRGKPALSDLALNSLSYDATHRSFRLMPGGQEASPLVVRASPRGNAGALIGSAPAGGLLPLAKDPRTAEVAFQRAGWVFLGGGSPWVLNCTLGPGVGSPLEEGHLLRRSEHVLDSTSLPGFQEKHHLFGFAEGLLDSPIFGGRGDQLRTGGEPLPEGTALLHLSGDLTHATPVLALGRVYRRFLRFIKLRKGDKGPFEAFEYLPDAAAFAAGGDRFTALTGRGFDEYARFMPGPVIEPYNRCYDYLVTNREESEAARPYRIQPGDTPFSPAAQLTASRVGSWLQPIGVPRAFFLYPAFDTKAGPLRTAVRISRPAGGGLPGLRIFAGDLAGLDRYAEWLAARATCVLEKGTAAGGLASFMREAGGRLELALPGIVHLGSGDLELPPLTVRRGGALIVEGNLTLKGGIDGPAGEPLVLVSLAGDIRVATSDRVRAALLAPAGRLRLPESAAAELHGTVMTATLDNLPEACAGRGPRTLTWDPELDCTDGETVARSYRITVGPRRDMVLERRD